MSNPLAISKLTGGVDAQDILGAVIGIFGASMLPGYIIKTTETTSQKLLKLLVAAGVTVGLGYVAKKAMPSAAKAVVIGGLAGTATQAIGMFTSFNIGRAGIRQATRPILPTRNYPTANYPNMAPTNIGQTTKPEFQGIPTL